MNLIETVETELPELLPKFKALLDESGIRLKKCSGSEVVLRQFLNSVGDLADILVEGFPLFDREVNFLAHNFTSFHCEIYGITSLGLDNRQKLC